MMPPIDRRTMLAATLAAPVVGRAAAAAAPASLVVLAPPRANDSYYAEVRAPLLAFYARALATLAGRERVILAVDDRSRRALEPQISAEVRIAKPLADMWLRDFAAVQAADRLVKFAYRPRYLEGYVAKAIERSFLAWLDRYAMPMTPVDLVLDGGNVVADGAGRAIVTERVLADNPSLDRAGIDRRLRETLALEALAIVPEEPGDLLGHADGLAAWVTPGHLALSRFAEPFRSRLLAALEPALPGIDLHEVPYRPSARTWRGFQDAAGNYANVLATPRHLYVPTYGLAEDATALALYARLAARPVIGIETRDVALLGGALNCISLTLRGAPAARLLEGLDAG